MSIVQPEEVLALLHKLGDDPCAVADALHDEGIRGHPNDAEACPIANYLRANEVLHPEVSPVGPGKGFVSYGPSEHRIVLASHIDEAIGPVLDFAWEFDWFFEHTKKRISLLSESQYLAVLDGAEEDDDGN